LRVLLSQVAGAICETSLLGVKTMTSAKQVSPKQADDTAQAVATDDDRRLLLRTLGFGALAAIAESVVAVPVLAQQPSMPRNVPIERLEAAQIEALKQKLALPDSTPITALMQPRNVEALTPAARSLTKADLKALARGELTGPVLGKLTVDDVASISKAFAVGPIINGLPNGPGACCCCCHVM
jgi:hypothetical protein